MAYLLTPQSNLYRVKPSNLSKSILLVAASIAIVGLAYMPLNTPDEVCYASEWTLDNCSCVSYARQFGKWFPKIRTPKDLQPNTIPFVGSFALFDYDGLPHIGLIAVFKDDGFVMTHRVLRGGECYEGFSFVAWNNRAIRGFYTADNFSARYGVMAYGL